jgi:hypothetical protein
MARKVKAKDADAPEITAAMFRRMRPMKDVDPGMVEAIKAARGRPRQEQRREVISVRLSHPAKTAWDSLPTEKRTKVVQAMERAAIRAAQR